MSAGIGLERARGHTSGTGWIYNARRLVRNYQNSNLQAVEQENLST